ncbi:MAG: GNAT family N-acetyltransferase [Ruminococcus sp.]|nr:GNAT family N-acetyltransferase [Ruminococcus sp.]MBQ8906092.1 GNAT family N-acetyltransferase [Ruminococcus sp.]
MEIRFANETDIPELARLLHQVCNVHAEQRPDLFRAGARKYTDDQLCGLLRDENVTIFSAVEAEQLLGYAFCMIRRSDSNALCDIKTLYIDDLCVDENCRGRQVGTKLYEHALQYAREIGCYNVTLNVWACNEPAMRFYEKCGMQIQKIGMETIL